MNRVVFILLAGLAGALVLSVALGSVPLPLDRVLAALAFQSSQGDELVVWQIRLPRALAAAFVGAALGCGLRIERAARNCGVKSANTTDVGHTVILSFLDAGERRPRILHPYKFAGSSVE